MASDRLQLSDLPVYITLAGGLVAGAVALPFVQADLSLASVALAAEISFAAGLLLAFGALLAAGLFDWVRPAGGCTDKRGVGSRPRNASRVAQSAPADAADLAASPTAGYSAAV